MPESERTERLERRGEKLLSEAIAARRATPSFELDPVPNDDLERILRAGLSAPSSYNMQPWRFIVVRNPKQKRKLRSASYNQAKVEEAPVMIVACGDADCWRKGDVEEMLRLGRQCGMAPNPSRAQAFWLAGMRGGGEDSMTESYAERARVAIPNYLSKHPDIGLWLNRQVMIAFTHMMLMAEVLGYDTAPMEGFDPRKIRRLLKLPASYYVVALLGIGRLKGPDKYNGGRFSMDHTVFAEEYGQAIEFGGSGAGEGSAS